MDVLGIRSRLHLKATGCHRHNMQRLWRLESAERAGPTPFEEAWTAQASYNEDGSGGDGISERDAQCRDEAISY